ncbi:hypothetical protein ABGF25_07025, partial [Helcococcus ovis]
FDKIKSDNSNFKKLELNKKSEESKQGYNHKEKFNTIDDLKPLDKAANLKFVVVSLAYKYANVVEKI